MCQGSVPVCPVAWSRLVDHPDQALNASLRAALKAMALEKKVATASSRSSLVCLLAKASIVSYTEREKSDGERDPHRRSRAG